MRLGDMKSNDKPVPAEVEAELDALDAALRGEEVPAGMEGLEALVSDLRAEKPKPDPRFEAELDDWAAAGFPAASARARRHPVADPAQARPASSRASARAAHAAGPRSRRPPRRWSL